MSNTNVVPMQAKGVVADMAERQGMDPKAFEATVRATVGAEKASREQFAAFLMVAREYELNPLTKEIYAFPARNGGIQPIVSIDGWMKLMNNHPMMNGLEFDDHVDDNGKLVSITAKVHRKDRDHPIVVTEYLAECERKTDPWKQFPARMLRHKAAIQAARYAFGFSGFVDPDEADRIDASSVKDVTPRAPAPPPRAVGQQAPPPPRQKADRTSGAQPYNEMGRDDDAVDAEIVTESEENPWEGDDRSEDALTEEFIAAVKAVADSPLEVNALLDKYAQHPNMTGNGIDELGGIAAEVLGE